jgi:mono/diheme cytochrome c family protein
MAKLLLGALLAILLIAGVGYAVVASGRFVDVAASAPADFIDRLAPWAFERALHHRAKGLEVQIPTDRAAVERGLVHYKENCLPCHAAPGIDRAEFAQGLNPSPPELYSPMAQEDSDAELFWITKNGIRMTGMPAFGGNHRDDEIRDILAFVRYLPNIDEKDTAQLRPAAAEHHHQH